MNNDCLGYVSDTDIISGFRSDHSGIILNMSFNQNERGRGYWKFNNLLLKDKDYITVVKETINEVKNTYIRKNNDMTDEANTQNISNEQIEFTRNDQLFLETLLLMIRVNSIKFSSLRKKKKQADEKKLENEIKELENEITNNLINVKEEVLYALDQKKTRLTDIQNEKIEGIMLRSRTRYEDLGEKPSSYFFNSENRNFINKVINKLIDETGTELTETKEILNCQMHFYKNLYNDDNLTDDTPIQATLGDNPKQLNEQEAKNLEGEITFAELGDALKNMKNNKTLEWTALL